jgi:alpha-L-fucosidase
MLVDIVSKNGNLLLSVPLKADGTFDEQEEQILRQIGDWMAVNKEGIVATRPWEVFGEGPAMKDTAPLQAQGFNEGRGKPLTWQDVRYTVSKDGKALYAIVMGRPEGDIRLQAVKVLDGGADAKVSLLGYSGDVTHTIENGCLTLKPDTSADSRAIDEYACVFKLSGFELDTNGPADKSDAM